MSAQSFPLIFFKKFPCFNGSLSSTFAGVNIIFKNSLLLLIINQMEIKSEELPHVALSTRSQWLRHTRSGVESTKLISIHGPNSTCLMKMASDNRASFSNCTKRLYYTWWRKDVSNTCTHIPCNNA